MSQEDKPSPGSRAVRASLGERGNCAWVFAAAVEMWGAHQRQVIRDLTIPVVFQLFLIREVWPRHNRDEGPQPHVARHTLHQGSPQPCECGDCPGLRPPRAVSTHVCTPGAQ